MERENANIIMTHLLLSTQRNGPFIELSEDNLVPDRATRDEWSFNSGAGVQEFLARYQSQYTTGAAGAYVGHVSCIVDSWDNPLTYDLNDPETDSLDVTNRRVRGPDVYSWGLDEEDDDGEDGGRELDDIGNWK